MYACYSARSTKKCPSAGLTAQITSSSLYVHVDQRPPVQSPVNNLVCPVNHITFLYQANDNHKDLYIYKIQLFQLSLVGKTKYM